MSYFKSSSALVLSALLAGVACGQEATKDTAKEGQAKEPSAAAATDEAGPPRGERARQWLLERFDEDKNGELSDAEREKAREFRRERMEQMQREGRGPRSPEDRGPAAGSNPGRRRGPEGRGPAGRGPRDGRGPDGRGPEGRWEGPSAGGPRGPGLPGPGAPGFMPNPMRLFNAFDEDKNEQLSKDEFEKLVGHLRAMRGAGRPVGPPGVRGPEGRDGRGPGAGPDGGRRGRRMDDDRPRDERRARPERDGDDGDQPKPADDEKSAEATEVDDATV